MRKFTSCLLLEDGGEFNIWPLRIHCLWHVKDRKMLQGSFEQRRTHLKKTTKLNFSKRNWNCTETLLCLLWFIPNNISSYFLLFVILYFYIVKRVFSLAPQGLCVYVCMSCFYLLQRAVTVGQIQSLQAVWVTQEAVQVLCRIKKHTLDIYTNT